MRVVLDTSVLVSAVISSRGTLGKILQVLSSGKISLVYTRTMLVELLGVLLRPRIREKYRVSLTEIKAILRLIRLRGTEVFPTMVLAVCRDPTDNKFLEAAVEGQADIIITGDADLIALNPFGRIEILSPTDFISRSTFDK